MGERVGGLNKVERYPLRTYLVLTVFQIKAALHDYPAL